MTHKVHPKIYRIKEIEDWQSRGFYGNKYPLLLEEDTAIRTFLEKKLREAGLSEIIIERIPGKLIITIEALRPGFIIGRGGEGIEKIRQKLQTIINRIRKKHGLTQEQALKDELRIEVKELRNPWIKASVVSRWIADQIEKRMPFRRTIKRALEKVAANKEVKGVRIEVAGRLDGAEIARREWIQKGRLPRTTLRSDIDYALAEAHCTYGVIGVKVWIYKGEKLE